MSELSFTVLGKPEPQGSAKAFMIGGKARITSANPKMKSYRQECGFAALRALSEAGIAIPMAPKHTAVSLSVEWFFERPPSIPRKRVNMVVKPDADKLLRCLKDSMTGIVYADDAQVTNIAMHKRYGSPARTEVSVRVLE